MVVRSVPVNARVRQTDFDARGMSGFFNKWRRIIMNKHVKTMAECAAIGTMIGLIIGLLSPFLSAPWGYQSKDIEVALAFIPHLYHFGLPFYVCFGCVIGLSSGFLTAFVMLPIPWMSLRIISLPLLSLATGFAWGLVFYQPAVLEHTWYPGLLSMFGPRHAFPIAFGSTLYTGQWLEWRKAISSMNTQMLSGQAEASPYDS